MSQRELLKYVADGLSDARIAYMVVGSHASSVQGHPRSTMDIDFVVQLRHADVPEFLKLFPSPRYYADEQMVRNAINTRSEFNVICTETGYKLDFWVLEDDPYRKAAFERRCRETFDGAPAWCSTPEDTILSKLLWSKLCGGSEKQMLDASKVYRDQSKILDHIYMNEWAQRLGVADSLSIIRETAAPQ